MSSVAQIIHAHEDEIMQLWLGEARAAASARGLSKTALENVMQMFLSALADQIETGQLDANDKRHRYVQNHLSSRLREGFELAEIVREFIMMERSIAKLWLRLPQDNWPSYEDLDRLHHQIHVAITDVTDTFHRHLLEDEQTEKRFTRRLQVIASEALHDVSAPLRDRMRDVLEVVMEAMNAKCAAFLLADPSKTKLVLVSCAGAEALEPYVTSLDSTSFAGKVGLEQIPTSLHDATSTSLDVPDSLRNCGVRALLGIRLPPHNALIGVVYVGIAEAREFTQRETRRFESLAERLALHLENARLFDALHEKIDALGVEKTLREQFVSTLAHDLRGPLSGARLAAELLAMRPDSLDERRELAVKIDRNIERVDRMIRDLLDANRIRAGEPLPLRIDTCDLVQLVEHVAEDARMLHGDRFVVQADGPLRGKWSADELHRAIWNLVTNAVKYGAPRQAITITVSRRGDQARVSVHNVGTPIPKSEQEHIFDAYARAKAHAYGRTGWGLGLTLVKGAIEAHGGRVSLTSNADVGTTFTLEFPLDVRLEQGHAGATVH